MKKLVLLLLAVIFCLSSISAWADDRDTAVALVKKAIAFSRANGAEKLIEEVSNPKGQFVDGAFYVFVMDLDAVMLSHPFNPSLIGQPQIAVRDVDGKYMTKEMRDVAKANGSGWVDYRFKNPKTGEIAPKSTYVEKADDLIIGCGIYRK
jgi:signal transduction histidine kinase